MLLSRGCVSTELIVNTTFDYETKKSGAIPPNWMGDSDRKALESLAAKGNKLTVTPYKSDSELQQRLKDIFTGKDTSKKKDTVCVIYLSAHAVLESFMDEKVKSADADIVLLAKDDDLESKTKRVRLSEVWNALERLPKEQKKLVLLDLSRLLGEWRLGIYDNFVIEAIQEAVQKQKPKIENLFVMTSSSAGETSWVSSDLGDEGQSVFGHFVARGLAGEADESGGKPGDRSVTVLELFRYVHTRVNEWVINNRDPAGQHPRLFAADFDAEKALQGKDSTFAVCAAGSRAAATSKSAVDPKPEGSKNAIAKLLDLWTRRQKLEQPPLSVNAIYHLDPVGFRALTQRLMRAEEFVIHRDFSKAISEIDKAETLCGKLETLAKQGHFATAKFTTDEKFVRQLADRYGLGSAPELKPAVIEQSTNATPNAIQDKASIDLPDEHLAKVLDNAHKQRGMPVAMKTAEVETCRMALVELRKLAESVAFGHHTVLPWLRNDLLAADQSRREAEDSFFIYETAESRRKRETSKKDNTPTDDSAEKGREVQNLVAEARLRFEKLQTRAKTLQGSQFALNRACATLPEWLAFVANRWTDKNQRMLRDDVMSTYHKKIDLNNRPTSEILAKVWMTSKDDRPDSLNQLDKEILAVALEAIELRELLPTRFAPISDEQFQKLQPATSQLTERLDRVQRQLQHEAESLSNSTQKQYAGWHLNRDLLRCPNLKPATREELLGKLIHSSSKVKTETDGKETVKEAPINDHQTSLWQMLCTIHALSLVPAPKSADDKLWDGWHKARRLVERDEKTESREQLIHLSRKLRDHWVSHSVETITERESWELLSRDLARDSLERKDLSARILFASDAINLQQEPTRRLGQFLIAELLLNSSERYLDDFWNEWYVVAAQECLSATRRLDDKLLAVDRQRVEELFSARRKSELSLEAASVEFGTQKTSVGSMRIKSHEGLPIGTAASWLAYKENDPRALKNQILADSCKPQSVGLAIAQKGASAVDEGRVTIERPAMFAKQNKQECQPSLLVPRVFFRDHTWLKQASAKFNPCEPDGTQLRFSSVPTMGGIRVDGSDRASVVFVLDASGSMIEKNAGQIVLDRWTPAKAILLDVLADMRAVDRAKGGEPHQVELVVYGHIYRDRPREAQVNDWHNVETVLKMSALNDDFIGRVRSTLERLEPHGSTPLLSATKKATDSLKVKNTPGTIIVITDGFPNDGARVDLQKNVFDTSDCQRVMDNLKREIGEALGQAQVERREIELQVIGQGFSENLKLTENEQRAKEDLKAFIKKQRGNFYDAEKNEDLRKALRLTTKGRPYLVAENAQSAEKYKDAPLGQSITELSPGKYRVAFASPERLKDGPLVELIGGELLNFRLLADGQLEHIHPDAFNGSVQFRRSPLKFGFLQSFKAFEEHAEFVVGIQNAQAESDRKTPYTERPERIVFEISPKNTALKAVSPMICKIEPSKSDPTWNIQLNGWPKQESEAEIKAYATWGTTQADELLQRQTNGSWPDSVELPLSKTTKAKFKITVDAPNNELRNGQEETVEVRLSLNDPDNLAILANNWRHLAYLHVQLRQDDRLLRHLEETAEVIATANEIRWKFSKLPEDYSGKRLKIAITSWHTFEQSATTLEQSLAIKAE
ncbi:MAG: VWA domain-containing protein [Planctomycetia bacterium]|nr:VWA domain-containing protein [Planctomycetia bacterium]